MAASKSSVAYPEPINGNGAYERVPSGSALGLPIH